jgi:replicative DNA helicase
MSERHDPRAEREAVAASLRGQAYHVLTYAKPSEFHDPARLAIMFAIEEMLQGGTPVTRATLCDRLRLRGELTTLVLDEVEAAMEYREYDFDAEAAGRIVHDMAGQREARRVLAAAVQEIDLGRVTTERIVGSVMSRLIGVSSSGTNRSRPVAEICDELDAHIERLLAGSVESLTTGIDAVDQAIGGIQFSEVFGLTGPPGSCKSVVKNRMNLLNAAAGYPVVSYVLEMTPHQETIRSVAIHAGGAVSAKKFRGGRGIEPPTPEEVALFKHYKSEIRKLPIWVENSKFGLMEILADAERRVSENGVKLITVDYAQLILAGDGSQRTAELERISQAFRVFAQKNHCAVCIVVKLDKAGALSALKGQELTGAELHGSSSFHYDMSSLVSLYFDKPMWLCECPVEEQFEWDKDKEAMVSIHTPGLRKYCSNCHHYVKVTEGRMGNAFVLKARDGDTFTKVPLKLEGATLQIREVVPEQMPSVVVDDDEHSAEFEWGE